MREINLKYTNNGESLTVETTKGELNITIPEGLGIEYHGDYDGLFRTAGIAKKQIIEKIESKFEGDFKKVETKFDKVDDSFKEVENNFKEVESKIDEAGKEFVTKKEFMDFQSALMSYLHDIINRIDKNNPPAPAAAAAAQPIPTPPAPTPAAIAKEPKSNEPKSPKSGKFKAMTTDGTPIE